MSRCGAEISTTAVTGIWICVVTALEACTALPSSAFTAVVARVDGWLWDSAGGKGQLLGLQQLEN